jgi:hypothetical protein
MLRLLSFRAWMWVAGVLMLVGCQLERMPSPLLAGGCAPSASPYLAESPQLRDGRITYCQGGDGFTGSVVIGAFPAGRSSLTLLMAGYADEPGMTLSGNCIGSNSSIALPVTHVGDKWKPVSIEVPPPLRSCDFQIRLTDNAAGTRGWAGIGNSNDGNGVAQAFHGLAILSSLLAGYAWLIAVTICLPDRRLTPTARIITAMLVLGASAYVVFLAYVASPQVGKAVATLLLLIPFVRASAHLIRNGLSQALQVARFFAPSFVLALLILWIGLFPFDWNGDDWSTPASRWRDMPIDNWLPLLFAQMLKHGEIVHPLIGDWLSSDRPPLQTGLYLLLKGVFFGNRGLGYQAISTWAQTLVLVPLCLLVPRGLAKLDRALLLVVIGLSALVVVNGLFVWPKLFAATYCGLYHVLLFSYRGNPRFGAIAAGAAAALALLSHGGALFPLAGSTIALVVLSRSAALKRLAWVAVTAGAAYFPWVLYQRLLDPPGDRLLKWHFAGQVAPIESSFLEVVDRAYSGLSLSGWVAGRLANVKTLFEGSLRFFSDAAHQITGTAVPGGHQAMIESSFFSLNYSMWMFSPLLVPLFIALAAFRRRPAANIDFSPLVIATVASLSIWIALMFVPASTIVHQGGYFTFISLQFVVMVLAERASTWLFRALAALNVLLFTMLYVLGTGSAEHALSYSCLAIVLCYLLLMACLAMPDVSEASVGGHDLSVSSNRDSHP